MKAILIAILVFASSSLAAQPGGLPTYKRPDAISLSGTWEICFVKPLKEVLATRKGTFDPPLVSTEPAEAIPDDAVKNPHSYFPLRPQWQPITVPDAWELTAGIDYNDAGWYRKTIVFPSGWIARGSRLWIEFDAVATVAGVWLNGTWLGGHSGDFARWRVEATALAHPGENELLVYVDELPGHMMQGFLSAVAPHYGGIWQDVRLYHAGAASLETDAIRIQADPVTGQVTVRIENRHPAAAPPPNVTLHHYDSTLWQRGGGLPPSAIRAVEIMNDDSGWTFSVTIPSHEIWSPEHPSLYIAEVTLVSSRVTERLYQTFGFRSIRMEGSTLLLNGSPLYLRSLLTWGYYPRRVAPLPTPEVVRNEFAYLRSLGFNGQTACLITLPDFYYDIADEMGILIWQEYPTWHNEFVAEHLPMYQKMFPALIRRDRNHPSIVLRSISVEAGVKDKGIMADLVRMTRTMTGTPVQDNGSWIWLSDLSITDWYGENNYWNNDQWARYYLQGFPSRLDTLPPKPYIPSETVAGSVWPDLQALGEVRSGVPLRNGLTGTDAVREHRLQPYWYPAAYQTCLRVEQMLRERYNSLISPGRDIVRDYLLPQSRAYALAFRRFQSRLLKADPRYAGFTMFLARNTPTIQSGLIDDAGAGVYTPGEWSWFNDKTAAPVGTERTKHLPRSSSLLSIAPELQNWDSAWPGPFTAAGPVFYTEGGYADLASVLRSWPKAKMIDEREIAPLEAGKERPVVITTALTHAMVSYIEGGGIVLLFTNRFPGGLASEQKMFWGGAMFAPPVGVFNGEDINRLFKLHQFDLTYDVNQVVPTGALGLDRAVDPVLRFFELHGLDTVITSDIVFASRCGRGMLVATALDHRSPGGEWVLSKLVNWASAWTSGKDFPVTSLSPDSLRLYAVERSGSWLSLLADWRFSLDPGRRGEEQRWYEPSFNDSGWAVLQAAATWESQGFIYDGMAWYRRSLVLPPSAKGRRIILVSEGINDGYNIWVNGHFVASYGSFTDPAKNSYQTRTKTDITDRVNPGGVNSIALQIVDIAGVGGIGRPIYVLIE